MQQLPRLERLRSLYPFPTDYNCPSEPRQGDRLSETHPGVDAPRGITVSLLGAEAPSGDAKRRSTRKADRRFCVFFGLTPLLYSETRKRLYLWRMPGGRRGFRLN